jgi:hypothetical protein
MIDQDARVQSKITGSEYKCAVSKVMILQLENWRMMALFKVTKGDLIIKTLSILSCWNSFWRQWQLVCRWRRSKTCNHRLLALRSEPKDITVVL